MGLEKDPALMIAESKNGIEWPLESSLGGGLGADDESFLGETGCRMSSASER